MPTPPSSSAAGVIRPLRARRSSAPVPAELHDAADPVAVAFHVSAAMGEELSRAELTSYWGVGRPKHDAARRTLIDLGLWIDVRIPSRGARGGVSWGRETRTVETRVTDRDLAELALEYPAGTKLETAGQHWQIAEDGSVVCTGQPEGQKADLRVVRPEGQKTDPRADQVVSIDTPRVRKLTLGSPDAGVSAGQPEGQKTDPQEEGDLFEISGGEISKRSATPPRSAGAGDAAPEDDWARQLVRALPWQERGGAPTAYQARQLAKRFRAVVAERGWTAEEVRDYTLDRLAHAESNPISYVLGAFDPSRLPQEGFSAEPLSENPLPLPGQSKPKKAPQKPAGGPKGAAEPDGVDVAPVVLQKRSEGDSGAQVLSEEERAARAAASQRARAENREQNRRVQARRLIGR